MATLDPIKNFARVDVSIGYDYAAVSVALSAGEGAKLPQPSTDGEFNLVWFNYTDYKNPTDDPLKEIVRVTARTDDTLTITRAQEETSAQNHNIAEKTYVMILGMTKKMKDDIETAIDSKEDSLGYTPEDVANKETSALDTSTDKYPCNDVVKTAVDAKVAGPASAVDENIPVFNGITGKIIKDSGYNKSLLDALNTPLSDEGLVLYLPFDENTGTTAYDKSFYGNNGTFKGAGEPAWSEGRKNTGVDFDGVDDYVDCSNPASLNITGSLTLMASVKLGVAIGSQPDSIPALFGKRTSTSATNNYVLYLVKSTSDLTFGGAAAAGGGAFNLALASAGTYLDDLEWHDIVATWDSVNKIARIYIDGVMVGEATGQTGGDLYTAGNNYLHLGHLNSVADSFLDGKMDEVRIYNRALSANEVMARYLKG